MFADTDGVTPGDPPLLGLPPDCDEGELDGLPGDPWLPLDGLDGEPLDGELLDGELEGELGELEGELGELDGELGELDGELGELEGMLGVCGWVLCDLQPASTATVSSNAQHNLPVLR